MATGTIKTGQIEASIQPTVATHVMRKQDVEQNYVKVLYKTFTELGNVGTGEDDLMSYTVLANSLSVGNTLSVDGRFMLANNSNNKRIKGYFGATLVFDTGVIITANTLVVVNLQINVISLSAQNLSSVSGTTTLFVAGTEDLTTAKDLKFTAEGVADNDITQKSLIVTLLP